MNKYIEHIEKKAGVGSKAFKELKTVANMGDNRYLKQAAKKFEEKYGAKDLGRRMLSGKHISQHPARKLAA